MAHSVDDAGFTGYKQSVRREEAGNGATSVRTHSSSYVGSPLGPVLAPSWSLARHHCRCSTDEMQGR